MTPAPTTEATSEKLAAFAEEAARYFSNRPTNGEDSAHWSNVTNAETCRKIASLITQQAAKIAGLREAALCSHARGAERDQECFRLEDDLAAAKKERDEARADLVRWRAAFQRVTPGGSEFFDPKAVREWADSLKMDVFNANKARTLAERRSQASESREAALLEKVRVMGEALETFANMADFYKGRGDLDVVYVQLSDIRRAARAHNPSKGEE